MPAIDSYLSTLKITNDKPHRPLLLAQAKDVAKGHGDAGLAPDIHKLFDAHYLTIHTDYRVVVSRN
jgi:hypothetical protein